MSLLNAGALLSMKLMEKRITIPDLGDVIIKELTGRQRDSFELQASMGEKKGNDFRNLRAKLVIESVCHENGELMFSIKDLEKVNELPARVLSFLFDEILKFNGIGAVAIEEAEKNSETPQLEQLGFV